MHETFWIIPANGMDEKVRKKRESSECEAPDDFPGPGDFAKLPAAVSRQKAFSYLYRM
jgi:hypothetical protein